MPQLLSPTKIINKDGEFVVHLVIDLNINLNGGGGGITVSTGSHEAGKPSDIKEEEPAWEVPEFGPATKVKFGKSEDK